MPKPSELVRKQFIEAAEDVRTVEGFRELLEELRNYAYRAISVAKTEEGALNAAKFYGELEDAVKEIVSSTFANEAMTESGRRWYGPSTSEAIARAVTEGAAEGLSGRELVQYIVDVTGRAISTVRHWLSELGEEELAREARRMEREHYGV